MTFARYFIDDWFNENIEYLGTKAKAWFTNPNALNSDERSIRYLFKEARENTGEDWSEKIACELAKSLGLPCAEYDLACCDGKRGVITPTFLVPSAQLVPGNEFLRKIIPGYGTQARYQRRHHTLRMVLAILLTTKTLPPLGYVLPDGLESALDVFTGYLMFDAWICNPDRHDENWGFVVMESAPNVFSPLYLAPTFDHASCLGRELTNQRRREALTTRDGNRTVEKYIENCGSGFFATPHDTRTMKSIEAFNVVAQMRQPAAQVWKQRLNKISEADIRTLFSEVPADLISTEAIDFAVKLLALGKQRLVALIEDLQPRRGA